MTVSELTVVQPVRGPPPRLGTRWPRIEKLVSGGWFPRGRLAEDGPIPARYPLTETPSGDYAQRTEWNVRDSDATLVLLRGPARVVALERAPGFAAIGAWLGHHDVRVLNVAGPRESARPGIYGEARACLESLLGPGRAP